jgi:tetraacyldisaccharide 4'-kinase
MNFLISWVEEYLFYPKGFFQKCISIILLPFTLFYCLIVYLRFPKNTKKLKNMGIPVISVGNIVVGGSGKTPFCIALVQKFSDVAVVLRGYNRASKGLFVVSLRGEILEDVSVSGDEAMEIAIFSKATVIVCEDRKEGIAKAKELGAKIVVLDDGFDKDVEKFNLVLDLDISNKFCLPSGGYRYPRKFLKFADMVLKENRDFYRNVNVPKCRNCILISAISKPQRLLEFVKNTKYYFFPDHHNYTYQEIEAILQKYQAKTILTTNKDYVKLKDMGFDIKVISLNIEISHKVIEKIEEYLVKYDKKR